VTTRDIAARAGVQQSLIHRHFGTKQDLVREVVATIALRYTAVVASAGDDVVAGFDRAFDFTLAEGSGPLDLVAAVNKERAGQSSQAFPGAAVHLTQLRTAMQRQSRRAVSSSTPPIDPRFVGAAAMAFSSGWAAMEDWLCAAFELDDMPRDEVRAQMRAILEDLVVRHAGLPRDASRSTSG